MSTDLRLVPDTLALLVVDVQERLAAAMPEPARERCVRNIGTLLEAARLLEIPTLVTEQYPAGLGPTVPALREQLDLFEARPSIIEKRDFDAMGDEGFADALDQLVSHRGDGAIRTLLVAGMEAHVCVYLTVRSLVGGGYSVQVPWDATCSRVLENQDTARGLWTRAGAVVTTTETVIFDLMGSSRHPSFKALSARIR